MKAAVYRSGTGISYEDLPMAPLAEHEIRLKVAACGICGSDLHAYRAGWVPDGTVLGHEYSGVVVEIGPRVARWQVGDRLAVIPTTPCGVCPQCSSGRENLCEAPRKPSQGGFAEYVSLPEDVIAYSVPAELDLREAAFLEPLAVAARAVNRAAPEVDDTAVVLGLGSIGLAIVQVLKAKGVGQVIAIDIVAERLELARRLGADVVIDGRDGDVASTVRGLTGSASHRMYEFSRARVVFECTGAPALVGSAIADLCVAGGVVVMVGLFEQPVTFDPNPLVRKDIDVRGSYAYTRQDWDEAFRLIAEHRVDVLAMLTRTVSMSELDDAVTAQLSGGGDVKIQAVP